MRNIARTIAFLGLIPVLLTAVVTCIKVEKKLMVVTGQVNNVLANTAQASGTVVDIGEGATQHGHCYSTSKDVSLGGSSLKTELGKPNNTGDYTSPLTNLTAGTTYYIKAYVRDANGYVLGKEIFFTTQPAALPSLTTTDVTSVTRTSASSGGNISSDGGASVTVRGICWSASTGPTIANNKTSDGSGTGSFVSNLTGLAAGTTYYVRAYATNSTGTAYGNEVTFTSPAPSLPSLTTTAVTSITRTSAISGGNISSDGGASVTVRGICWSASTGPTIANNKTSDGYGTGSFASNLTGLAAGTTYYVRAYATNSTGTAYGNEVTFTSPAPSLPSLITTAVTSITRTSAISGGNVTGDGGAPVTARGVCWSNSTGPTISDSKTSDGSGTGSFASSITSLGAGKNYYIRAYATNSAGTAYGNELSFTTEADVPTVTTSAVSSIAATTAISGGNVTDDNGAPVTARGVCWGTSANPTIALSTRTSDGTGTGSFTSGLTGLTAGTTYYVRAYATNSAGTAYGNEISFTTIAATVPVLTTTSASSITGTDANSGGNVTSDGGAPVTARGVCWSTTQNPTTANSKTADGSGTGKFTSSIIGLTPVTPYYIRAYATNSAGTAYGAQVSFTTLLAGQFSDIDGNVYNTVTIGTQVWMKENLKTTMYNDGTAIPLVTDNTVWIALTTPAYCWYNNNAANYKAVYGALYNWYAVNTGKLCPTGWHVPTDGDWTILTANLGGGSVAGGKLKETGTTHWISPNTGATNETGFTALPGGYRIYGGAFDYLGLTGSWWSSTEDNTDIAWVRGMGYDGSWISRFNNTKVNGFSVRCLRD